MSIDKLPLPTAIVLSPQPFLVVKVASPTAGGIYVRSCHLLSLERFELKRLIENLAQARWPDAEPIVRIADKKIEIDGVPMMAEYLGYGLLKINLCEKKVLISDFVFLKDQRRNRESLLDALVCALELEPGFEGFTVTHGSL